MGFFDRFRRPTDESRSAGSFTYNGNTYPLLSYGYGGGMFPNQFGSLSASRPQVAGDLTSVVAASQPNSIVSAAIITRAYLMSQLWMRWRDTNNHNLFGDSGLALYERPEMPEWLMAWEQMACLTGNVFIWRDDASNRLRMLRSDWVQIMLGSNANPAEVAKAAEAPAHERQFSIAHALDAEVVGYVYQPPMHDPQFLSATDVAHWKPEPHPLNPWLGASPVTSVIRELAADTQADIHTDKFFEKGATPQLVYTLDKDMPIEKAAEFKELLDAEHSALENSWKAMYLGGGTDVTVVGSHLKDLGLKDFRGQQEVRIAARMRVPAVVLGISEGMQGAALNAGNYAQTRRMLADGFFTPHASGLAAALQKITPLPTRGRGYLSWDPERVLFLQEDQKDAAEIYSTLVSAIRTAVDGGFDAKSTVDSAAKMDVRKLKHTNLLSVQLQEPGKSVNNNPEPDSDPEGEASAA